MPVDYQMTERDKQKFAQFWNSNEKAYIDNEVANDPSKSPSSVKVPEAWLEKQSFFLWQRWKCQTDLYYLATEIIGLKHAHIKVGQKKRYRLDPMLHRKMCEELQRDEDTLQLYSRSSLKTTLLKIEMVRRILCNQNIRIGLWSKTLPLAKKELKSVKQHFEKAILRELFPDIIPTRKKWEKDTEIAFTMLRDPELGEPPQEAQIECWGIEASATGHHYDIHFYDDILNEKSITNATQLQKVIDWYQFVQSIRDIGGIEKMIGTRYHLHDLYGEIARQGYFAPGNIITMQLLDEETGTINYKFYTRKDIDKLRKRIGEYKWSCQYQNRPVPQGDRIFKPPYPIYAEESLPKEVEYYVTVDPAPTINKESNQTGIWVVAIDKRSPNKMYIIKAYGIKKESKEIANEIVQLQIQYRPVITGIELGLQQALQALIDIKIHEWEAEYETYIPKRFIGIGTGNQHKSDKFRNTIGALISDGRVLFPGQLNKISGFMEMRADILPLIRQMDTYNPYSDDNEDDIIDAGAIMTQTIPNFAPSSWFKSKDTYEKKEFSYTVEELLKKNMKPKNTWDWDFAC